jgi:translation initiation factor 2 gamma subunit (eIF-2gamma)
MTKMMRMMMMMTTTEAKAQVEEAVGVVVEEEMVAEKVVEEEDLVEVAADIEGDMTARVTEVTTTTTKQNRGNDTTRRPINIVARLFDLNPSPIVRQTMRGGNDNELPR